MVLPFFAYVRFVGLRRADLRPGGCTSTERTRHPLRIEKVRMTLPETQCYFGRKGGAGLSRLADHDAVPL